MQRSFIGRLAAVVAFLCGGILPAAASPWAEVGDDQLRGDIALLAAAGVIDGVTTQWPLSWASVATALRRASLEEEPAAVRAAAARVLGRAVVETAHGVSGSVTLDATNTPGVVYGFDGMGRGEGQAQFSLTYNAPGTSARLSLGALSGNFTGGSTRLMLEGSYIAQKVGPMLVYGGYLDHWWGPGWISALSVSNNARPMPQIGIERIRTAPSSWPVLRWLGPWQAEFFLGYLDGPRIQKKTFYNALRLSFNPLPGLEVGLSRTEEFCGEGHPCSPLRDYFDLNNDSAHTNRTNDQGAFDIKYSHSVAGVPAEIYMQVMNEDTSPFTHSGSSHLFGGSLYLPAGDSPLRLTLEYTDSVATADIFSFGDVFHGFAYNNGTYLDGMRYRGRTLGFSLDSDSRLLSLQGSWSDAGGRFYELSFHHAAISNPNIPSTSNIVTSAPVIANIAEARFGLPWRQFRLDFGLRIADDQPRPGKGANAAAEARLQWAL